MSIQNSEGTTGRYQGPIPLPHRLRLTVANPPTPVITGNDLQTSENPSSQLSRGGMIRRATLTEIREALTVWVLREIDDAFLNADIEADERFTPPTSGQRRSRVEQYYVATNWNNRAKVESFLRHVAQPLLAQLAVGASSGESHAEYSTRTLGKISKLLTADGFKVKDGIIVMGSGSGDLERAAKLHDVEALAALLRRITNIDDDPWLAIGTAKEIIEALARAIVHMLGDPDPPTDTDLLKLTKLAVKPLRLLASDVPEARKGSESIRKVLAGLAQIVGGTAELRNLYGTGHGRRTTAQYVYGRHARLVVASAIAWADFVIATWQDRQGAKG